MESKLKWAKAGRGGGSGAALSVLLGFSFLFFGERLSELSYDLPFLARPYIEPGDDIVIIYMDERTHQRLDQGRWDRFDRSLHAELLGRLQEWGARTVAFDVLLSSTTNSPPANDAKLVQAAVAHGNVVVAAKLTPRILGGEIIHETVLTPPFLNLETNAAGWGLTEIGGPDTAARQHYRDEINDNPYTTLAWRTAELSGVAVPPNPLGERWLNYYGPPGWIPWHSYVDVLQSAENLTRVFSNRVVFIGAQYDTGFTGGKGTDDFRTPYTRRTGRKSPGVEITATTYLNLARNDWLRRPAPLIECLLVLAVGVIAGFGLVRLQPFSAAAVCLAAVLAIAGVVYVLFAYERLWFPWLVPAAVELPAALAWSMLYHTRRLTQEIKVRDQREAMARGLATPGAEPGAAVYSQLPGSTARPVEESPGPAAGSLAPTAPQVRDRPSVPDHTLLRRIGAGAYGEIWLARDIIGSYHAVKIVYRHSFNGAGPFEREFKGIRKFTPISRSHPGFVNILHVGRNEDPEYIYYVMEVGDDEVTGQQIDPDHYSARNLDGEIARRKRLPLAECVHLGVHLADALRHLHQHQLIHRDIKPSNIIFVQGAPKLADIGLVTDVATQGKDVTYLGTEGYIPPEGPGTAGGDVYSLGKVIYQTAFGLPVERYPEIPATLVEEATSEELFLLNKIILKACEGHPEKRYGSAAALHADLLRLQQRL